MTDLTAVSLFAGIGGFDLALARAGVKVVAAVEIDPAARKVLARHFPDTVLFEDVREVTGDTLRAAGFVPGRGIVTAGWPCQGNSVAGRRGGLADPRSGLWSHVRRLLAETSSAWFIGENVPGLLSVNNGRDFRIVLDDLADLGMGICWRILDAQHFGVPQRRRRVIVIGRAGGDARGPVEVLLEPEGRARDCAPGGEAGQEVAGTLGGGSGSRGWAPDTDRMTFIPVAAAVTAKRAKGVGGPVDEEAQNLLPVPFDAAQITSKTNRSNPRPGDPTPSLAATGNPHVAYTLTSGVSSPGVPRPGHRTEDDANLVAETMRSHPRPSSNSVGAVVTHALTAEGADASEDGTGRGTPLVPVAMRERGEGAQFEMGEPGEPAFALPTPGGGSSPMAAANAVRRLTPLECERLQGFPDGWTEGQSDAARYRELGNAVAVPCVEWVARRVVAADAKEGGRWGDPPVTVRESDVEVEDLDPVGTGQVSDRVGVGSPVAGDEFDAETAQRCSDLGLDEVAGDAVEVCGGHDSGEVLRHVADPLCRHLEGQQPAENRSKTTVSAGSPCSLPYSARCPMPDPTADLDRMALTLTGRHRTDREAVGQRTEMNDGH